MAVADRAALHRSTITVQEPPIVTLTLARRLFLCVSGQAGPAGQGGTRAELGLKRSKEEGRASDTDTPQHHTPNNTTQHSTHTTNEEERERIPLDTPNGLLALAACIRKK